MKTEESKKCESCGQAPCKCSGYDQSCCSRPACGCASNKHMVALNLLKEILATDHRLILGSQELSKLKLTERSHFIIKLYEDCLNATCTACGKSDK